MSKYQVTLTTPTDTHIIDCVPELSILDSAAAQGIALPATCRGGACSACVARLVAGPRPDQSEQSYLSQAELDSGFILLCVAYPTGDCQCKTHQGAEYQAALKASP